MKTGARETVAIIEGRPAEVIRALAVNEKLDAVPGDDRVPGLLGAERHFVLETGATTLGDPDAQTFRLGFAARFEEAAQLPDCVIRHGDHRSSEIIVWLGQVKPGSHRDRRCFPSQSRI
jgi:hypothetical protein